MARHEIKSSRGHNLFWMVFGIIILIISFIFPQRPDSLLAAVSPILITPAVVWMFRSILIIGVLIGIFQEYRRDKWGMEK
jgi:hypothetical protein